MQRVWARGLAGVAVTLWAVSASASGLFSDGEHEREWEEGEYELPAPPSEANLRSFFVSAASPNEFYVDESSLTVGDDAVVRYVLVVRTRGGAENVTFEGIRCASGERRIYALGREGGEWTEARRSEWEPLRVNSYNMPRAALAANHFCDGPVPPRNRAEALRGLRDGLKQNW